MSMRPDSSALEEISKGSILRKAAEKTFRKEIEDACAAGESTVNSFNGVLNTKTIKSCIRSIVYETMDGQCFFPTDADFYHNGCDSAKCARVRNLLLQVCSLPRLTAHIDSQVLQNVANGDVQLPLEYRL